MRVVKSYVREDYEKKKFAAAAENVQRDFTKAERIMALNGPMMQFCVYAGMVFVMSYGSYTVITTQGLALNVGQMSSMLTYSFQILMSLMMLSMVFTMITMSQESAERIVQVLTEESTLTSPADALTEVKDGSVDFDHVSFKYSKTAERSALSDIDLHIQSGEVIGILGGTGSSKSSLVQLIPRLYDATEGSVKVGGVDVRRYDLETLRNQVAVVLQKNVLFSGTIKDNLRWGNPGATDEQMLEACRLAQADEFIQQFPDKYDTWIEQGGTNVLGRPETAPVHCPRPAEEAQDPDPGRLHQRRGHPHRRPDPQGLPGVHPRDHQDHHCPACVQRAGRRPHHYDGGRAHRGCGHPSGIDGEEPGLP